MFEYFTFLQQIYILNFVKYFGYFISCTILLSIICKSAGFLGLVAIPNNRSFHSNPTPVGGGLAIALIILLSNYEYYEQCPEFFIGAFVITLMGLIDDRVPLAVAPRLICQCLAVGAMVVLLPIAAPIKGVPVWIIKPILFVAGVWFINVYNFMDGIDGLAGGYANAAAVGFLFCIKDILTVEVWNIQIYNQIIYITLAFLIFNWSPAKIFMGDTGSTFLGFTFFSLGIRALIYGNYIIYSFIIIMAFFWIDATITITRRFIRKAKIFSAHKEHAFHKATAKFGHWKVSLFIILVTLFWLNPMARFAVKNINMALPVTIAAVLPILFIIIAFSPGTPVTDKISNGEPNEIRGVNKI
jgi:Fuc2NAc and GlcNAc transferase